MHLSEGTGQLPGHWMLPQPICRLMLALDVKKNQQQQHWFPGHWAEKGDLQREEETET